MKPLMASEFDADAEALYLRYSGEPVAQTVFLDGENGVVSVDVDTNGETIGIELVVVDDESVALATRYANDHHLGLSGAHFPHAA